MPFIPKKVLKTVVIFFIRGFRRLTRILNNFATEDTEKTEDHRELLKRGLEVVKKLGLLFIFLFFAWVSPESRGFSFFKIGFKLALFGFVPFWVLGDKSL